MAIKSKLVSERLFYHLNVTYESEEIKNNPAMFNQIFEMEEAFDLEDFGTIQSLFETAQRNHGDCITKINKVYNNFAKTTWSEI